MKPVQAVLLSGFIILGVSLLSPVIATHFKPAPPPVIGQAGEFELIDSNHSSFNSSTLKGKVWVTNFFFTNCGGICPFVTGNIRKVYNQFEGIEDLKFVSITVDPERDGPTALMEYAENFSINTARWHFLTGTKELINKVSLEGFKLGTFEDPAFHTEKVVLIDRNFNVRGYYSGTEPKDLKRLAQDAKALLGEKFNG